MKGKLFSNSIPYGVCYRLFIVSNCLINFSKLPMARTSSDNIRDKLRALANFLRNFAKDKKDMQLFFLNN